MFVLIAILLGIIEGVTEFLPISSTGHLILAQEALNYRDPNDVYTVVIQIGAIAAVVWYFRKDLWARTRGLIRRERDAINFWKLLVIASIPAGIAGLLLDKSMEAITVPVVVAAALIIGGIILWLVDNKPVPKRPQAVEWGQVTVRRALLVGVGQCVAIIPGVSRSGATIVTGLLSGLNRPTATALSFYLSIPILFAAGAYKLVKYGSDLNTIEGGYAALALGTLVSFVTALAAIAWLLKFISTNNFKPFAYYRVALGCLILGLVWAGVM